MTGEFASLTAGTIARAMDEDVLVQSTSISLAEEALSWRRGYLTFHDTSLADAVAEFNRYNSHKILVGDAKAAAIRISAHSVRPTTRHSSDCWRTGSQSTHTGMPTAPY